MGRSIDVTDQLVTGLRALYSHLDLDSLPRVALRLVNQLVPCDVAAYNEIDLARNRVVAAFEPEEDATRILQAAPHWERFVHQHPLIAHFRQRPDDIPRKITDFLPQAKFESLDLYRTFFGPLGLRYQMVTSMPVPSPLVVGISQNRGRRDFSERDRRVLNLVRPHLRQAYENAALVSELRYRNEQAENLLDRIDRGQIVIDSAARVRHVSPAALRLIVEFFPTEPLRAATLPKTLEEWAKLQMVSLTQSDSSPRRPAPLMVDGAHGRLSIRLIADSHPGRFVTVITHAGRLESSAVLCGMGITTREADVLYWCIEGKSRMEIGVLLHISDRTVQKHLERLYAKLDVPNRVAAVTKAMEWVRW